MPNASPAPAIRLRGFLSGAHSGGNPARLRPDPSSVGRQIAAMAVAGDRRPQLVIP
ncbi:hypothetical protein M2110_005627 [Paenibacillus sp. PastF-4]|uniref:hypothetical protein n=1 Tax=Paenibacillus sp. PastF-4 TaxID=2940536 RepID=UPI002473F60E|nr:hypothetical protein [Paenibacillus sp. PastF-4]MDH6447049.1 hypothetical protein [Paenibacillus sp. PastF-4]